MRMSFAEFEQMKGRFHCASVCDEQYLGPFDVDAQAGGDTWRIYVEGSRFQDACNRVKQWRKEAYKPPSPMPTSGEMERRGGIL